jgi:RsiW-degrading membrane proteinase PrsW (M82 family)
MSAFYSGFPFVSLLLAVGSPFVYGMVCLQVNRGLFRRYLVTAVLIGLLASFVAYLVELWLFARTNDIWKSGALYGFILLVALPEEIVKLAGLNGLIQQSDSLRRATLVIASFIGCGFAAGENIVYLQRFGAEAIAARFFTATAFHPFNAILMARALSSSAIQDPARRIVVALCTAVALHGTYDYLVAQSYVDGGRFLFILGLTAAAGFSTLRAYPMKRSS